MLSKLMVERITGIEISWLSAMFFNFKVVVGYDFRGPVLVNSRISQPFFTWKQKPIKELKQKKTQIALPLNNKSVVRTVY